MGARFIAIRKNGKGRQIGVFDGWRKAAPLVYGERTAEYQGFDTMDDAIAFMNAPSPDRGNILFVLRILLYVRSTLHS